MILWVSYWGHPTQIYMPSLYGHIRSPNLCFYIGKTLTTTRKLASSPYAHVPVELLDMMYPTWS